MTLIPLHDPSDPRLAVYRDLKLSNLTRGLSHFITEGEKLLRSLVASSYRLRSAVVEERYAERIRSLMPADAPLYVLSTEHIQALAGYRFHLGVLACGERQPIAEPEPALKSILERHSDRRCLLLALPHIDNPENLGAIIRTAHVFGAAGILVGTRCPDHLSRRVLRVSMGRSLALPLVRSEQMAELLRLLKDHFGFRTAAAVAEPHALPVRSFRPDERLVLLLGNESHGLADELLATADYQLTIPMRDGADSLNVAAATAIFCYEIGNGNE